jgi:hypothetical protein
MSGGRWRRIDDRRPNTKAARARVIVGIDETDRAPAEEVRRTSDALLDAVRRLHELEREKRAQQLSTPEFHAMAHEITEQSREVFRLAAVEERAGDEVESQQDATTEDIEASRSDGP